jgi:hypothetical protein
MGNTGSRKGIFRETEWIYDEKREQVQFERIGLFCLVRNFLLMAHVKEGVRTGIRQSD